MDKRRADPEKLGGTRGVVTVDIKKEKYLKLLEKSDHKSISIRKFIDDMVTREIENSEFLLRIVPALSLLTITEGSVMILDKSNKTKRIAEILIRNGRYVCDLDNSSDCKHIKFMLIMPESVKFKDCVTHL
jgi:hypothetical protein